MSNLANADQSVVIRPYPWVYVALGLPFAVVLGASTRGPNYTTVISWFTVAVAVGWALTYTWIGSHKLSVTPEEFSYDAWFTRRVAKLDHIRSAVIKFGKFQKKQDVSEMRLIVSGGDSDQHHVLVNARVVLFRKKDVDRLFDALHAFSPWIEIGRAKSMVNLMVDSVKGKE